LFVYGIPFILFEVTRGQYYLCAGERLEIHSRLIELVLNRLLTYCF